MTAVLMTLGMVGGCGLQLMIRGRLPGVPWTAQQKRWSRIVLLMLGAGSFGLIDFWGELSLLKALEKITVLTLLLFTMMCMAQLVLTFYCPVVWVRSSRRPDTRAAWILMYLFAVVVLLSLLIDALPETLPARLSFARMLMLLSILGFVCPPLFSPWLKALGLDPASTGDLTAAFLMLGNICLIGTMIAWPESVSAGACFDARSMLALCSVLAVTLVLGYPGVRRHFGSMHQNRKNGVRAFWLSLFMLSGCALVLMADMEHQYQYCGQFRGPHPSVARQPVAERVRLSMQPAMADPARPGAVGAAAVDKVSLPREKPAGTGGARTSSATKPEAPSSPPPPPRPLSAVDALRAGLSAIDARLTIAFLEEPSRGVHRLGLNWWHADLEGASYAIDRGIAALHEAAALVAASGLRFVSVEMRLMGMVQDRYGVRRPRPLMRWRLDEKTMGAIRWATIHDSDLLDLVSVELEAEGLVPLMDYCDKDEHARESPVFCRLAALRRVDRQARLHRQLEALCEAAGTDLDGAYDGLEMIEDLCRDI